MGEFDRGPAVVQYLADQKPDSGLAPRAGSFERYQLMEILNYITSELHKNFSPLFNAEAAPEVKKTALANLEKKFQWLGAHLDGKKYLMGDTFTVADAYLFTVLSWSSHAGIDLAKHHVLTDYLARVGHRPKVQEALKAEGSFIELKGPPPQGIAASAASPPGNVNCSDASRAYNGLCASSSACVPTAILCP